MKKLFCLLLIIAMVVTTVGCQSNSEPPVTSTTTITTSSVEDAPCTHDYETVRQESTCTEQGYVESTCRLCGQVESKELDANGHSYLDATCTAPKTCSICGTTEGSALDHSYENGACIRCGTVPPAPGCNHSYQITAQLDPTCIAAGSATHTCTQCGYYYSQAISANGHS